MPPRIFISVGDDSADLHASHLMRAIRRREPDVEFVGLGLSRMREEGLEPLHLGTEKDSAMWLHNAIRLGHYQNRAVKCSEFFAREHPDLVIPIDFGGFNMCLSMRAARAGLRVFYYIPPQVWAHGRYRLKKLRKWVTKCGLIYPFEPPLYERWGVAADYVGHPLFDELQADPPSDQKVRDLRGRFGERLVGIFPGSRRQEVIPHMAMLRDSCAAIRRAVPDVQFALLAPPRLRAVVDEHRGESGIEILDDVRPVELARASRICLAKSGTITLEIASQETPTVIFYRANPLVAFMAWGLSHTPVIGIINNLAGRIVCPERPTTRHEPDWITRNALRLLQDEGAWEECRAGIRETLDGFAVPGASERAAESALSLI
jgi:lipid-A-disaccharide synthase